jgi:hypothetical protein
MDSKSNSSLYMPSTNPESSRSGGRGALAKAIWDYTRMGHPNTTEDPKKHYCLVCKKQNLVPIYSTIVSSNQRYYLSAKYSIFIEVE